MYRSSIIIDTDVFEAVKSIPKRIDPAMSDYIDRVVVPEIERLVNERVAVDPGPVKYPFKFATAKSRRWYFANFKGRLPYRRTGELQRAWRVELDRRRNEGYISLRNVAPSAVYVYGTGISQVTNSRQVPGHRNTGWGDGLEDDILYISTRASDLMATGWLQVTENLLERK